MGNMIESAYTLTSAENVGYAIWTSFLSGALAGGLTATSNKLTKSYFDKSLSNVSKKAQKQINQYIKNAKKIPTNNAAIKIIKDADKLYSRLDGISSIITYVLGAFY